MKILQVKDLYKSFGEKKVLQGVDLYVNKGEIVGLLGKSGTGKSTIFNIIAGTLEADFGQVLINGQESQGKLGLVSYMVQEDLLLDHFTIIENVSLPMIIKGTNKKEAQSKAKKYLADFGLGGTEDKYPAQLSGGMRQRAALLRTYLDGKDIMLLDEPFSAIDMISKEEMHQWFLQIREKYQLSALFISHDIEEAIKLSDRIYILGENGKIKKELQIQRREDLDQFVLSKEFMDYKREIYKELKTDS